MVTHTTRWVAICDQFLIQHGPTMLSQYHCMRYTCGFTRQDSITDLMTTIRPVTKVSNKLPPLCTQTQQNNAIGSLLQTVSASSSHLHQLAQTVCCLPRMRIFRSGDFFAGGQFRRSDASYGWLLHCGTTFGLSHRIVARVKIFCLKTSATKCWMSATMLML